MGQFNPFGGSGGGGGSGGVGQRGPRGYNCEIQSIVKTDSGNIVTFKWMNSSGTATTSQMVVKDGVSIVSATVAPDTGKLYFTDSDGKVIDAGKIEGIDASAKLSQALKPTVSIGSVKSNYAKGTDLEEIIRDMLIKIENPVVTLQLNPAATVYDAVNGQISSVQLIGVVRATSNPVVKVQFYDGSTVINERTVNITNGSQNITYSYTPSSPIKTTRAFKVVVTDSENLTGSSSVTVTFIGKSYYGTVAATANDLTAAQIKALNSTLKTTKNYVYSGINMAFGKVVYAYPKSLGALSSIMDKVNNLNYNTNFQRTEVKVDNIDYYVYTQISPSAASNVEITFS